MTEQRKEDSMPFEIRPPLDSDLPVLAILVTDWGYPSGVEEVAERLARLRESPSDVVRVAQAHDRAVAGWIHAGEHRTLASAPACEILGLVVGARHRKLGIGRALVETACEWARRRGLTKVQVHSNVIRPEAHPFYESVGFTRAKTQHVYTRSSAAMAVASDATR